MTRDTEIRMENGLDAHTYIILWTAMDLMPGQPTRSPSRWMEKPIKKY